MNKRLAGVLAAGAIALGSLVAAPGAASAAQKPGCVTKWEFHHIYKGWTKSQVHRRFDVNGKQTSYYTIGGTRYETREYNPCTHPYWGQILIDYKNSRVTDKYAYWG